MAQDRKRMDEVQQAKFPLYSRYFSHSVSHFPFSLCFKYSDFFYPLSKLCPLLVSMTAEVPRLRLSHSSLPHQLAMEIWHWEMRPSVVKFKPIYLPGKLVDASLSLYPVRLKITNALGSKPWDEV